MRATERGFIAFVPAQEADASGQQKYDPNGKPLWVARARTLELGYRAYGKVEVLRGLVPGEPIVVKGAEALENNTPIRVTDAQQTLLAGYR